jgi:hypothetical protein
MTEAEQAIAFVESKMRFRILPKSVRAQVTRDYVWKRECGDSHKYAMLYAKAGLSPVVLFALGILIQILIEVVRVWWERRNPRK